MAWDKAVKEFCYPATTHSRAMTIATDVTVDEVWPVARDGFGLDHPPLAPGG
jgi:hypothetical protein